MVPPVLVQGDGYILYWIARAILGHGSGESAGPMPVDRPDQHDILAHRHKQLDRRALVLASSHHSPSHVRPPASVNPGASSL